MAERIASPAGSDRNPSCGATRGTTTAATADAAASFFADSRLGTLEAGKLADVVILDRDLFAVPPEEMILNDKWRPDRVVAATTTWADYEQAFAGVDVSVIALWLGHERMETTPLYLQGDLATKEKALAKLDSLEGGWQRFHADDPLLAFLTSL